MNDGLAAVAEQLRALLLNAEDVAIQRKAELDAAKARTTVARDDAFLADAEVRRLTRALKAIEGGLPNHVGRPRGSGDPAKTRERVRALLHQRPDWSNAELRTALAEDGHHVAGNNVSAALAALARDGAAVHGAKHRWSALRDAE